MLIAFTTPISSTIPVNTVSHLIFIYSTYDKQSSSNFSIWISFNARASCKFKIPVPATGVFASLPPIIFGAIKKYTLSTNFFATKLPLKVAPPSTKNATNILLS